MPIMSPLCACLLLTAQFVNAVSSSNEVKFVSAEFRGEEYRRLIEPMTQFVADAVTCPSTQVL
jgi:hypothetical protein